MNASDQTLPWLADTWARLSQQIQAGRLPQAMILSGNPGVGKRRLAQQISAALLCESRSADGQACAQCRSCQLRIAGHHPNLLSVAPERNAKTGQLKRDIAMEQLRSVMESLSLASHFDGARVVRIDPAEALNQSGVNALLKTVEEPPPRTHIILIAERPLALAATLRSRCQQIPCPSPPQDEAQAWLTSQGAAAATAYLAATGGAPLAALAWHQSDVGEKQTRWRKDLLQLAQSGRQPLELAAAVDKPDIAAWLEAVMRLLLDLYRAAYASDEAQKLNELARSIAAESLENLRESVIQARKALLSNANPQLTAESLMILWWRCTASYRRTRR
ncbi:MAG: DNA polymerase III subunit delta' [Panacagrimonas sp.]